MTSLVINLNIVNCFTLLFMMSASCFSNLNDESQSSHQVTLSNQGDSERHRTPTEIRQLLYGDDQTLECGRQLNEFTGDLARIFGGRSARYGEFPWHVALFKEWPPEDNPAGFTQYLCGGTIIGNYWILTAARCLMTFAPTPIYVVMGTIDLRKGPNGEVIAKHIKMHINLTILHPKYHMASFTNDIAILRTSEKIDLTGNRFPINSACLPDLNEEPVLGDAIITGFGQKNDLRRLSLDLKTATVPIFSHDECTIYYGKDEPRNLEQAICAGYKEWEKENGCFGDDGGPLVQKKQNDYTVFGIYLWSRKCGFVSVFTRVSNYINWIYDTIEVNRYLS